MDVINHRNKLIVKSNTLIESKYSLTGREQKFLIYLASLVKKDDLDYKYTSVKIKDLEAALKAGSDAKWGSIYEVVREIVLNINKKPITIRKDNGGWTIMNWFTTVDADPAKGVVTFELSNTIKTQLVKLNEFFTKYRFGNILALRSGYSIRIYELLKLNQYKHKVTYELDFFRELIGVSYKDEKGNMVHKYPEYKAFKRSIIKHAQGELKEKTDIYFELKEGRVGRKVTSITFYVFKNNPNKSTNAQKELFIDPPANVEEEQYEYNEEVLAAFMDLGLEKANAQKLYKDGFNKIEDSQIRKKIVTDGRSLDEYFFEKIDYVKSQVRKGRVNNPPGLLVKAIMEDYEHKDFERKKQVKEKKVVQKKLDKLKLARIDEYKMLQAEFLKKEEAIVYQLINGKDNLLEGLLKDDHLSIWVGYNQKKSPEENLKSKDTPPLVRFKIIGKVKKAFPDAFQELDKEKKILAQVKKEIDRF